MSYGRNSSVYMSLLKAQIKLKEIDNMLNFFAYFVFAVVLVGGCETLGYGVVLLLQKIMKIIEK